MILAIVASCNDQKPPLKNPRSTTEAPSAAHDLQAVVLLCEGMEWCVTFVGSRLA